jgi:hypothetical protein
MKNSKLFLVAMVILPWLTIPLLGRNALKNIFHPQYLLQS